MFKTPIFAVLTVLLSANAAFAARDILCEVPKGANTVNGISTLIYHQEDWEGVGKTTIVRNTRQVSVHQGYPSEEGLSWGEFERQDRGTNFSVEDYVMLRKYRDKKGSRFALVKVRTTLSGPHCDGHHACEESSEMLENVPVNCTDSVK